MDAKSIGYTIAILRRRQGLTQSELAARLKVSDKTVSKWENGLGYPEITQFPALAGLFGVSIDYIMTGERKGIALAGNILADLVKTIPEYPAVGMLTSISSISRGVGGCVPNTAINLAKIDRSIPLSAIGRIGDDEYGRYVVSQLQRFGVDTGMLQVSSTAPTSFSDVMSLRTGERTFFHARGANAEFSPEDVEVAALNCRMLHIGYVLLLDRFDEPDEEYGTVMARFLHEVQQRGIKTSIDTVSDNGADYGRVLLPALRYCHYVIINEQECCRAFGLSPVREDGTPDTVQIRQAMENMARCGVSEKVIVHSKQAGYCLDVDSGAFTAVPSLLLPPSVIRGSVGAGDAFCAGCLYGLYNGYDDRALLEFASAAAACNLLAENSVDGMLPREGILQMMQQYGRRSL